MASRDAIGACTEQSERRTDRTRMALTLDRLGQTAARDALLTLAAGEPAPAPREEPRERLRKNSE